MAIHKSAQKAHRASLRKKRYNTAVKINIKTLVKAVRTSILEKKIDEARGSLNKAIKSLDKAVTQGILHRNNASRRISRLILQINKFAGSIKS
ncbi:MAG TPA: 30S ribosomal protein S20 [bacterium]